MSVCLSKVLPHLSKKVRAARQSFGGRHICFCLATLASTAKSALARSSLFSLARLLSSCLWTDAQAIHLIKPWLFFVVVVCRTCGLTLTLLSFSTQKSSLSISFFFFFRVRHLSLSLSVSLSIRREVRGFESQSDCEKRNFCTREK